MDDSGDGSGDDRGTPDHGDRAVTALVDGEYRAAGDAYSLLAYARLGERADRGRDTFAPGDAGWVGYGLAALLRAALCYRAGGADRRGRNRCEQGRLVAEDLRDAVFDRPVQRAACDEARGDCLAVAEATDAGDAYDRAREGYEAAVDDGADPSAWVVRPLFEALAGPLQHAARNTSHEFAWDDLHGGAPASYLTHRVRFKRRRFPAVVDAVVEARRLHPPRGTTEHGSDDWRCPDCETGEVNWIGDEVVCLDCSTRMVRR